MTGGGTGGGAVGVSVVVVGAVVVGGGGEVRVDEDCPAYKSPSPMSVIIVLRKSPLMSPFYLTKIYLKNSKLS